MPLKLDKDNLQGPLLYATIFTASSLVTKFVLEKLNQKEQKRVLEIKDIERKELARKQREKGTKIPKAIKEAKNCLIEELKHLESPVSQIEKVGHLAWELKVAEFATITSPLLGDSKYRSVYGGEGFLPDDSFVYLNSYVLSHAVFGPRFTINHAKKWLKGGPRKHLFFNPNEVKAGIVTCGGLCPGLNVVIREIVMSLHYNYKVSEVWGVQFGYRGFYSYDLIKLTPEKVRTIQHLGGTILGSSRGGFDAKLIVDALVEKGFNQLYVIGGDGTHAGILELCKEIKARKLKIGICGLPKTIDNDIPIIDKSFGFETSVEESLKPINSAYVESHCCEYGVGLVRLMGRFAGFIAMEASLASRDVNICLVPEFKFELNGPKGLLQYIAERLRKKRHCVIVVAEGAGEAMIDGAVGSEGVDASGHVKAADIGLFIRDKLNAFCKKEKIDVTTKYVDPTYMIRSVAANPADKIMCSQLAQNAVHGLMAGFTYFSSGIVNNKTCFIPIEEIISKKYSNRIQPHDRAWQRLLASTGQPSFLNDRNEESLVLGVVENK